MPDLGVLENFHFLRPAWLFLVLPGVLFGWLALRVDDSRRRWSQVIAPHLLPHVLVGESPRGRLRPAYLVPLLFLFGALAMAGPSWQRQPSPFSEDLAPLVIAVDVSLSMNATDIQPTRLERAKQKIGKLLDLRAGSRTALIAYGGSAHLVLPLTDDPKILRSYLEVLATPLMPVRGKAPQEVVPVFNQATAEEVVSGTLMLVTDDVPEDSFGALEDLANQGGTQILTYVFGTSQGGPILDANGNLRTDSEGRRAIVQLNRQRLTSFSDRTGSPITIATRDDADVDRLARQVETHFKQAQAEDESLDWVDAGYWFVFPLAFVALFWTRRGWTISWRNE